MKKTYHKYILILMVGSIMMSCSSLDINDLNKGEEETFFVDRKSAEMAVSGAYTLARRAVLKDASWAMYSDIRSGMLTLNGPEQDDFLHQQLNSSQALFNTLKDWSRFYHAITQCNVVMEKVPEIKELITDEEKKQIVAEARFVRAMMYFHLVRIWGDVPLVTNTGQIDAMPKKDQSEVLALAQSDLEKALADLPAIYLDPSGDEDQTTSRYRATKGACYALLAHIHTWQGNYTEAALAVDNVINLEVYELTEGSLLQHVSNGGTPENIFSFNKLQNLTSDFELSENQANVFDDQIYYNGKVRPRIAAMSYQQINALFSGSDVRRAKYFSVDDVNETVEFRKISNTATVSSGMLRYADVLLLGAEANADADPAKAEALLNQVRNRAGLADYDVSLDGELKDAILTERRRELYGEGHDFFDLIRFEKVSEKVINISPADIRDGILLWPVSPEAFTNNALMTQNPFWN